MERLGWDDLRALIAVAHAKSLRVASEATGLSPATLSRRIDDLEASLGEKLLERMPSGCTVTGAGLRILAWAEQMQEIAFEIERTRDLKGSHSPEGIVRINTDEWVSYLLTSRFAEFRDRYPQVVVEVLTSHRPYSLVRREADISIRPNRPTGAELAGRRLGTIRFGLYGSRSYVGLNRTAIAAENWQKLAFVGFDEERAAFDADRWLRALPGAPTPWLRSSYALGIFDGVSAGSGLGVLAGFIAKQHPDLEAVNSHIPELDQEVWLTMHRALRGSARIKAVSDFVAEIFKREGS